MKKIIIALMISAGVYGCASTSTSQSQLETSNYEKNVVSSIEEVDAFAKFDQKDFPAATLEADDMSKLLQADVAFNQGIYAAAADNYYALAMKYKDPRIIYKGILCYQHAENGNADTAKLTDLVNLLVSVAPNSNVAKLYSIPSNLSQNNYDAAITNLHSLIDSNPSKAPAILLFITTMLSSNNYPFSSNETVIKFANYVVSKYGQYPESLLLSSIAYTDIGDATKLSQVMTQINKQFPTWELPVYWNAGLLVNKNNLTLLSSLINQEMIERKTPSANMQNLYVAVLLKLNRLSDANNYIESSADYTNKAGNMLVNKAVVDYKLGDNSSATMLLKQAESHDYNLNGAVDFALGGLSLVANDKPAAVTYFKSASTTNPALYSLAGVGLLRTYLAESNYAAVDDYIESMAKVSGKLHQREIVYAKLSIYSQLQEYNYAYKIASQNNKLYGKESEFAYIYASLAGLTDHTQQSIDLYKKYIKTNPKDTSGYNDLAYVLANKTTDYKQAMIYAKKAYAMMPNDFAVLDTIGWASFKLKQYADAEKYLSASYNMSQNPETAEHLKQVYLAQGNQAAADKIVVVDTKTQQLQMNQQLLDQSMLMLMYYQFGADFGK